jgi:radical SAM superfamily enzyme YgiQ (UPF0313 family)
MKFFLINPDYMLYGDPPLGLAYIASYIKKTCPFVKTKIIDQLTEKKIFNKLKKEKPEIIGLTAVSLNYAFVKKLAQKIKEHFPKTILILGGVHITTFPESFEDSPFDIAVRGEGEICVSKLINQLNKDKKIISKNLANIKGLLFRENKKIINTGLSEMIENLDEIPIPSRELLNMKYYTLPRFSSGEDIEPIGSLLTSRGCPYSCKFCSSSSFWGQKVRFFSASRVVNEIEILHINYNYNYIYIYDDLFSINKQRLKQIISILKQRNLLGKIIFSVYGRANCFDEETAKLLRELNVQDITFGFETGSQRLLTFLKGKGITIENGINAINLSKKYNLKPGGFFILGSPTENAQDMKETYEFIKDNIRENFIIYQTIPFPETYIWDYAIDNKIINKNLYENTQRDFIDINTDLILSKDISKEEFIEYFNKINLLHLGKKKSFFKKIFLIKPRHIKSILSKEFIKKGLNLRTQAIKRIS